MVNYMFKSYIIKDNILYLELDINYEFGSFNKKSKNVIDEIKDYIVSKKINLRNKKIILTCSGIIIGSILLTNFNNEITGENIKYIPSFKNEIVAKLVEEEKTSNIEVISNVIGENVTSKNEIISNNTKNNYNYVKNNESRSSSTIDKSNNNVITHPSGPNITIKRSNGIMQTINLEEYIIGVVSSEMPASFNIEALKAQSVVARTYALKANQTGKMLTDTVSTQSYIDTDQMRSKWGSSYNTYYNKIKNAVESTSGEYLSYNGNYIEALYHSTNNGKTESSLDVFGNYYPYLVSVTSDYDKSASSYLRNVNFDFNTLSNKLGINLNSNSVINIISYTDGGNIKEININGNIYSGKRVRELLGLRSADFDINIENNSVNITTRGYGHGVGMSQYGANGMANAGYGYKDILSHYYPGTILKK